MQTKEDVLLDLFKPTHSCRLMHFPLFLVWLVLPPLQLSPLKNRRKKRKRKKKAFCSPSAVLCLGNFSRRKDLGYFSSQKVQEVTLFFVAVLILSIRFFLTVLVTT